MKAVDELVDPPKTIMDVYKMLPEGTHAELIDGTLYMPLPPNSSHQDISVELSIAMGSYLKKVKKGKIYAAPYAVYLDEHANAVEPDLVCVLNKNRRIIKKDGIHGVPDLIIEILSPGNKNYDRIKKMRRYEKSGVKEFWLIDPASREATGYQLEKGVYEKFFKGKGKIQSQVLQHTFKF